MITRLFRALPGPTWLRVFLFTALLLALVYALLTWVYPAVDTWLNPDVVGVGESE